MVLLDIKLRYIVFVVYNQDMNNSQQSQIPIVQRFSFCLVRCYIQESGVDARDGGAQQNQKKKKKKS